MRLFECADCNFGGKAESLEWLAPVFTAVVLQKGCPLGGLIELSIKSKLNISLAVYWEQFGSSVQTAHSISRGKLRTIVDVQKKHQ